MRTNSVKIILNGKDDSISVESFLSIVWNSIRLMNHLADESVEWTVGEASHNSPLNFEVIGSGGSVDSSIAVMVDGLEMIESGRGRPSEFDDKALVYAEKIAKPLTNGMGSLLFVRADREPARVSTSLWSEAKKLRGPDHYYAFTELEGVLEMIRVHGGKGELGLYDRLTGEVTKCHFKAEDPEAIGKLITHRLRVFGKAKYNRAHHAVSIDVDSYESIGDAVSLDELHKYRFRLNSKLSSQDLIRRLREMDA